MTSEVYDPSHRDMGDRALPGFYEVITTQINVTLHPKTGVGKWVGIVRDPMTQVELGRFHGVLAGTATSAADALEGARRTLAAMYYLAGGDAASRQPVEP